MSSKVEEKNIAKLLFCSRILEEKIAQVYQALAERATNIQISRLVMYISGDSKKHSMMLQVLSGSIEKLDTNELKCKDMMDEAWNNVERSVREEVYSIPEKDDLAPLIKDMTSFESCIGEEDLSSPQVFLTVLVAEQSDIDISQIENTLDWIVQGEDHTNSIFNDNNGGIVVGLLLCNEH